MKVATHKEKETCVGAVISNSCLTGVAVLFGFRVSNGRWHQNLVYIWVATGEVSRNNDHG